MTRYLLTALWLAQPVLKAVLLAVLVRRKLHTRFPIFFAYLSFSLGVNLLLYWLRGSYRQYFYTYWWTNAITLLLVLAVIYELIIELFRHHHALRDLGVLLFRWAGAVTALAALLLVAMTRDFTTKTLVNDVVNFARAVGVAQVGLLLLFVLFSKHLKLSWREPLFGIGLGLGTSALTQMILFSQFIRGAFGNDGFNIIQMLAYNATLLIWLSYAAVRAPAWPAPNLLLKPQRWNDALTDVAAIPAEGTFMTAIGSLVDDTLRTASKQAAPSGLRL